MNWYLITPFCSSGMQDTKTSDGLYEAGRILPVGSIVPLEWKGRQRVNDLYLPANFLEGYEPSEEDMAILYMLWPSVRPDRLPVTFVDNPRIGKPGQWASGWYQISHPDQRRKMSSVPYGVSALLDIEGVCKAGDIAMPGDIVPAAFFAGLSAEQFDRMETIGLTSASWLNQFGHKWRAEYQRHFARPVMQRVGVTQAQKAALYEKFPAINPNAVQEVPKAKTSKRKA